eukprot:Awhi_evm1s1958
MDTYSQSKSSGNRKVNARKAHPGYKRKSQPKACPCCRGYTTTSSDILKEKRSQKNYARQFYQRNCGGKKAASELGY